MNMAEKHARLETTAPGWEGGLIQEFFKQKGIDINMGAMTLGIENLACNR